MMVVGGRWGMASHTHAGPITHLAEFEGGGRRMEEEYGGDGEGVGGRQVEIGGKEKSEGERERMKEANIGKRM